MKFTFLILKYINLQIIKIFIYKLHCTNRWRGHKIKIEKCIRISYSKLITFTKIHLSIANNTQIYENKIKINLIRNIFSPTVKNNSIGQ